MRVLHVEAGKHLYGGALQVHYLTERLVDFGVQSFLAAPRGAEIFSQLHPNVVPLPMKMEGDGDFGLVGRLVRLIKCHKIELVHLHSRRGADHFGILAAKIAKVPVVVSRRVDNKEPNWLAKLKYQSCNKVITISEGIRQVLLSEGVDEHKVVTVLSAVDSEKYSMSAAPDWFESEFNLDGSEFVIGMLAQLIPRKGHHVLFDALPQITANHPNTKVLVFGKGPLKQSLQNEADARGLQNVVTFCGFRQDLHKVLPNLDLVVHPAFTEGLGVSLLQASASGVPIIATKVGGIPEAVKPNVNGMLVDVNDSASLAKAVIKVATDHELRNALAKGGRGLVEQQFSTYSMAAGNYQVYLECLGREHEPA